MIPLYVRAPYIRDAVAVKAEYDITSAYITPEYYLESYVGDDYKLKANPIKIVGKTYEVSGIDSRQATKATGQG